MQSKAHYHLVTKTLLDAFQNGRLSHVRSFEIEPTYGYAGRVVYHNGGVRFYYGSQLDVNTAGAARIADDKGYTKMFLSKLGYRVADGRNFVMPHYLPKIDRYQDVIHRTAEDILPYINTTLGWPCYIKPNDGAQGDLVFRCASADDVTEALVQLAAARVKVILVEAAINLPDFRVVVYDRRVIAAYGRQALSVVGDGQHTLTQLFERKQQVLADSGRSVWIERERIGQYLAQTGHTWNDVPRMGEWVVLHGVANLSAGGDMFDYTDTLHADWAALCVRVADEMGLRLCGVDLLCADIRQPLQDYVILEINASPSMTHYATSSTDAMLRVQGMIENILNEQK